MNSLLSILLLSNSAIASPHLPLSDSSLKKCSKEYTIQQLNSKKSTGFYKTTGYVVYKYTCPPCPPGAECKPCMNDNIVISEKDELLKGYQPVTNQQLILNTEHPEQFKLGKLYTFCIEVKNLHQSEENWFWLKQ